MIEVREDANRKYCQECDNEVCDNDKAIRLTAAGNVVILDRPCAEGLYMALGRQLGFLTVNGMVDMAYGTASAAGWHDRKGERLSHTHAYAQLAALTPLLIEIGRVIEKVRKPAASPDALSDFVMRLERQALKLAQHGLPTVAFELLDGNEQGVLVTGSKTEVLAWMVLAISELIEGMEAILAGDKANYAEELADTIIRIGDDVGAINDMEGHPLGPIDLEATILAKNARNRQRGYRHGNKEA